MASDPYLNLLDELRELTLKKRAGYSPGKDPFANFRQSALFGVDPLRGILVRVMDKLSRVSSLIENPANDKIGESLRDNLIDGGNYLLIAVAYLDSEKTKAEREAAGTFDFTLIEDGLYSVDDVLARIDEQRRVDEIMYEIDRERANAAEVERVRLIEEQNERIEMERIRDLLDLSEQQLAQIEEQLNPPTSSGARLHIDWCGMPNSIPLFGMGCICPCECMDGQDCGYHRSTKRSPFSPYEQAIFDSSEMDPPSDLDALDGDVQLEMFPVFPDEPIDFPEVFEGQCCFPGCGCPVGCASCQPYCDCNRV